MYRTARKEAGLTLEEAAFWLHVAPRTLGKYESGELRVPEATVIQIAIERMNLLGVAIAHENQGKEVAA